MGRGVGGVSGAALGLYHQPANNAGSGDYGVALDVVMDLILDLRAVFNIISKYQINALIYPGV